jgi:hypothetical protein
MEDNSDVDSDGSDIDIGNFDENLCFLWVLNHCISDQFET